MLYYTKTIIEYDFVIMMVEADNEIDAEITVLKNIKDYSKERGDSIVKIIPIINNKIIDQYEVYN